MKKSNDSIEIQILILLWTYFLSQANFFSISNTCENNFILLNYICIAITIFFTSKFPISIKKTARNFRTKETL